ncbi:NAD(P)-binding protein [Meredithblackwellia eburnea MCA 4105]
MSSSSELVLVTGATGFLGSEVVLSFIERGFKVRGTARSQAKADEWEARNPSTKGKIEWAIVKDIVTPGAFDEAIKGVTILAHTASPFHYDVKDNFKDMLEPAIKGTSEALLAAKKTPSVKRVVVTSSFAANLDLLAPNNGVGITYTEEIWNPATLEESIASTNPGFVYCASKKLAEEEAWKIAKDASFALTVLNPPLITGAFHQVVPNLKSIHTSAHAIWEIVDAKEVPATAFPVFVDVKDIADLHVLATTEDIAKGKRYLTIAGHFTNEQAAEIIRANFPAQAHRIPPVTSTEIPPHYATDSSKVEKELGIKWKSFKQSIIETATDLFALEAADKASA